MKKYLLLSLALFFLCQNTFAQFPSSSNVYCYKPAYKITSDGEKKPANDGTGYDQYQFVMFGNKFMSIIHESFSSASKHYSDDANYFYKKLSGMLSSVPECIARGNAVIGYKKSAENTSHIYYRSEYSTSKQTAYCERYVYVKKCSYFNFQIGMWVTEVDGEAEWRWRNSPYYFNNDRSMLVIEHNDKYYYELIDINTLDSGHKSYEMF